LLAGRRSATGSFQRTVKKLKKKQPRNKFETKLRKQLTKAKVKFSYESEKIPYVIAGHYIPDFIITTPHGKIYVEAKGHFRPEAKRKMAAVKRLHPNLDIRIVFYSTNKTYIRWAEKHGFKYAIGDIPKDWLL
jgi:predicted nuclease of restriction endonuclease-like RecB superfamily